MDPAIEALLDGIIDYAGLFPPAKLDMEPAVTEYLRHLDGRESLLVNRFVCPTGRLEELSDVIHRVEPEIDFGISVIGTGIDKVAADRDQIEAFRRRFGEDFAIEAYEVKVGTDIDNALQALRPLSGLDLWLEIPLGVETNEALFALAESEMAGAKARTGGIDAAAIPSCDLLANFLRECLDLNLTFKLTAGLHHPIRHTDSATGAKTHGFLNVAIAAALAEEHDLNRHEIAKILADEAPRNFVAEPNEVGHLDLRADMDAIDAMRTLFSGFGSCSVSEPADDLKALGLW